MEDSMIQADTLPVVTEIATTVGGEVAAWVTLLLGIVIKLLVDLGKKLSAKIQSAPDVVKALVAVVFGQLAAVIGTKTGILINPDLAVLDTTLVGATLSAIAMGVHGLVKSLGKSTK